jgi:hypothetical protein
MNSPKEEEGWLGDPDVERLWFEQAQSLLAEDSENYWKWCESVEKEELWKVS